MTTTQHYVRANGLNVYYEVYGAGTPLILIHGGLGTGNDWQAHIPVFAQHFQVFVPDSRGHGHTDNPAGTLSYRVMADDLAAFVQSLGLHQPLIYGFSDGGQIALEVAMRYPQLARGMIVGAAWFKFSDDYRAGVQSFLGDASTPNVDLHRLETMLGDYMTHLRRTHAAVYGEGHLQDLLIQLKALYLTPLNYTADDFHQITIPTLILVGDRDEAIPVEEAVEMYRLLSTAELCVVPNTPHEQTVASAVVTQIALDFLTRHSPRAEPASL